MPPPARHSPDEVEQCVNAVDAEPLAVRSEGHRVPQLGVVGDGAPPLAHKGIVDDFLVRQVREDPQQNLVRQLVDGLRGKEEVSARPTENEEVKTPREL